MIVQRKPPDLLLITQPDHAGLAADLLTAWGAGLTARPTRESLLLATREHDNGWREPDAAIGIDEDGRPYDFLSAPDVLKQGIWPRAVARLAGHPRAAALVARHALAIYEAHRSTASWQPFFVTLTAAHDQLLGEAGLDSGSNRLAFDEDYEFLRLADLLSLTFCNRWADPVEHGGFRAILDGDTLTIAPDPFGGGDVPFRVRARRIPDRLYASDLDLQKTLAATPDSWLTSRAVGGCKPS